MKGTRKICVITGTRAEYGLLYWLMKEIDDSCDLELQVIVTGMHLSTEFGLTYKKIEQDGFNIDFKVEMLLSSDSEVGVSKSMGLGMIGFSEAYTILKPDIIMVLGDRFEIFTAVSVATVARIPIAHLHGGETTEGAFDEAFRHSITKMSHLHFSATEEYRNRVIQLGEHPKSVFAVGAMGIENIKRISLLSRDEFEESVNFKLNKYNLLVTFHPVTLEHSTSKVQFGNLLSALDELKDTHLFFTKANADMHGRLINEMIDDYVSSHRDKAVSYVSLGQLRYLSAMQYMDGVVGNSSSGIIEAPSFGIGTVNIGDRQRGRIRSYSVLDCDSQKESILSSIHKVRSSSFKKEISGLSNPYGDGDTSVRIVNIIRGYHMQDILKKKFYDINF